MGITFKKSRRDNKKSKRVKAKSKRIKIKSKRIKSRRNKKVRSRTVNRYRNKKSKRKTIVGGADAGGAVALPVALPVAPFVSYRWDTGEVGGSEGVTLPLIGIVVGQLDRLKVIMADTLARYLVRESNRITSGGIGVLSVPDLQVMLERGRDEIINISLDRWHRHFNSSFQEIGWTREKFLNDLVDEIFKIEREKGFDDHLKAHFQETMEELKTMLDPTEHYIIDVISENTEIMGHLKDQVISYEKMTLGIYSPTESDLAVDLAKAIIEAYPKPDSETLSPPDVGAGGGLDDDDLGEDLDDLDGGGVGSRCAGPGMKGGSGSGDPGEGSWTDESSCADILNDILRGQQASGPQAICVTAAGEGAPMMYTAPPGIECEAIGMEGALGQRDDAFMSDTAWGWVHTLVGMFIMACGTGAYKMWFQKKMEKEHGTSLPHGDAEKLYTMMGMLQNLNAENAKRHEESMGVASAVNQQVRIKAATLVREKSISLRKVVEEQKTAVKESAKQTPTARHALREVFRGVGREVAAGVGGDMESGNAGASTFGVGGFGGDLANAFVLKKLAAEDDGDDDGDDDEAGQISWAKIHAGNLSHLMEFIKAARSFITKFDAAISELSDSDATTDPNLIGNLFEGVQRSSQAVTETLANLESQSPNVVREDCGDILEQYWKRSRELDTYMTIVLDQFNLETEKETEIPKKYAKLASKSVQQLREAATENGIKDSDIPPATDAATDLEQRYAIIQMIIDHDEESAKTSKQSKHLTKAEHPGGITWYEDEENKVLKITQRNHITGSDDVIVDITRPEAESAEKQKHWIKIRKKMKLSVLISHRDAGEGVAGLSSSDDSPVLPTYTQPAIAAPPPPPGKPRGKSHAAPAAPPGKPPEYARVTAKSKMRSDLRQRQVREEVQIVQSLNKTVGMFKFLMSDERRPSPVLPPGLEPEQDDSPPLPGTVPPGDLGGAHGRTGSAARASRTTGLRLEPEYLEPEDLELVLLEADIEAPPVKD